MREILRTRLLDWRYTDRGSLDTILDDLVPRQYRRWQWTIYRSPDGESFAVCPDHIAVEYEAVAAAFDELAIACPRETLFAIHFANDAIRIVKAANWPPTSMF